MPNTYIGTDKINHIWVGTSEIKRAWVGTDLVYSSGGSAMVFTYTTANGTYACNTANSFYTYTVGDTTTTYELGQATTEFKTLNEGNEDWGFVLMTNGTLLVTSCTGKIDICAVGGGGGGGGGAANYGGNGYNQIGYGGYGGGGRYVELLDTKFNNNSSYSIIIGSGGSGGNKATGSYATASSGSSGGTTTIEIDSTQLITASGGTGGQGGMCYSPFHGSNGVGDIEQYCFGDEKYFYVSGTNKASYGKGGARGAGWIESYSNYASKGGSGTSGMIMIRNSRI